MKELLKTRLRESIENVKNFHYRNAIKTGLEQRFKFRFENLVERGRGILNMSLPKQFSWFYSYGIIIIILFVILCITGICLAFYYKPIPDDAFTSIKYIMNQIPYGWLIRSIHYWASNLLFFFLFLHLWMVFFTGAYKFPREFLWLTGLANMFIIMLFGFTGYLLPWDNNSFWTTSIMTSELKDLPGVGNYLMLFIRGGEEVGSGTLTRFFVGHITILPTAFLLLLATHLFILFRQGLSEWRTVRRISPTYSLSIMLVDFCIVLFALFALLVSLSVFIPAQLGDMADPLRMPSTVRPPWFMLPLYQLYRLIPSQFLFLSRMESFFVLFITVLSLLLVLPFLDKGEKRHPLKRPVMTLLGLVTVSILILLIFMNHGK